MSVLYGLGWTFLAVLAVLAATAGMEATVAVAGAVMRVLGWVLGGLVGLASNA